MQVLWLKIKVWTKIIIFSLLLLYIAFFIFFNADKEVSIWYWFGHEPKTTVLWLGVITLLAGIIGTMLVRTGAKTVRQLRDLRSRGQMAQMKQDVEHLKSRAGMLQTKPLPTDQASAPTIAPPPPPSQS